jgi:exodeoxyribonuclease VII large subunit
MERAMVSKVAPRRQRAYAARDRIIRSTRALIQRSRHSLAAVTGKMEALSPLATLQRGYAVPLDDEGRLLHAAQDFEPGQRFTLRVVDGRVRCEALESESE